MNRIKAARLSSGHSQKFVALSLGVTPPTVSYWESGRNIPSAENYNALASLFNVSVDYLMGRDEVNQTKKEIPTVSGEYSEDEIKLINNFRRCNSENQLRVLAYAEGAAGNQ